MKTFTVSFFGHRYINNPLEVEKKLQDFIRRVLANKEYVEFLVGRNGEFDTLTASAIRRVKKEYRDDNSSLVLVLPYSTAEYKNNMESFGNYYDEIEICERAAAAHFKSAIKIRNREMVDRSDLVVAFIDHESGGVYQAVQYAAKKGKDVFNIAAW